MVTTTLIFTLLAQASAQSGSGAPTKELAVLVSRRIGLPEPRAEAIARQVVDFLKERQFGKVKSPADAAKALAMLGVKDSADCDGKRECVSGLGRVLRVWGVVAVDLADFDGTTAIHVEAVESDKGEALTALDVVLPSKRVDAELRKQLEPLAQQLRDALETAGYELKPLPDDTPRQVQLAPELLPTVPAVEAAPVRGTRVGAAVAGGAALVAGALAIVFLVQAGTARGELDAAKVEREGGGVAYSLTESQAQALAARSNGFYSASLGTGIGALVLAAGAGVLWAAP